MLEADRRAAGVWLSADGLFLGAALFHSPYRHSAEWMGLGQPSRQLLVEGGVVATDPVTPGLVLRDPLVFRLLGCQHLSAAPPSSAILWIGSGDDRRPAGVDDLR